MIGVTVFLSMLAAVLGNAEPVAVQESFFEEGNRQYQNGDYVAALESYLQIYESGFESGALHYNIANCYVAGSSVFTTSGFANPTLTIVALSIRLADHLKRLES